MDQDRIIDIEPIEVSSTRLAKPQQAEQHSSATNSTPHANTVHAKKASYQQAGSSFKGTTRTYTVMFNQAQANEKRPSRLFGLVMIAFGVLLFLIGIPMLILPGPGLLSIVCGIALVVAGLRRLFRPFKPKNSSGSGYTRSNNSAHWQVGNY